MSQITVFTAPKPFTNPHIATIQRNAIRSWQHLGGDVEVLLIGEEPGLAEVAAELDIRHLPDVARNAQGTPLVSSIFELARANSASPLLAYVNADILLTPDFVEVAKAVMEQAERFLIVGQRWDLNIREELDFTSDWGRRVHEDVLARGRLHPPSGSDYFVFPRSCFSKVPPFAIGRAGWDNWMFFHARQQGWAVVNATQELIIIHQDHDYSHLPGGLPHYHLPETAENVRLAGGRRAIFSLQDADYELIAGQVRPIPKRGKKLWREIEIYPLITLRSALLGELSYACFHPVKAWQEWRGRLWSRLKRIRKENA